MKSQQLRHVITFLSNQTNTNTKGYGFLGVVIQEDFNMSPTPMPGFEFRAFSLQD